MGAAKISISGDHINMVKFKGASDDGFRKVYGELSIMLDKASQKIGENWVEFANSKHSGWFNLPTICSYIYTLSL